MSSAIDNIIESIEDGKKAMMKITVRGGSQSQFECIYKKEQAPYFSLVFPAGTLPEHIDERSNHPVAILRQPASLFLNATVVESRGDQTLYMVAAETLDPASLREYFRVNTSTEIVASYMTSTQEDSRRRWTICGQTQDLSGSGVLGIFDGEPRNRDNIHLEVFLPHNNTTINAVGHIIRKKRLRSGKWQVSFHFDTISQKHRDAVITFLLSEQRKQLRQNVRTADEQ